MIATLGNTGSRPRTVKRAPWWRRSLWFRPRVRGLESIPTGGALYVCNHSGGFMTPDTWIFAVALTRERGTDDVPYALAHQVVMEAPLTNQMLPAMGAIAANPENAHRVFAAGHKVLVYPGGDLDAFRSSRDRGRVVFGPRRGYVRLALREGVPIIPVVKRLRLGPDQSRPTAVLSCSCARRHNIQYREIRRSS